MSPLVLDLIAVFSLLEEDVQKAINDAASSGSSPDNLIKAIEELF